jgi:nucleotide-binding universal stress UspA family protein
METTSTFTSKKYCIAIDGSEHSDWAFDLILNDMYQKGDKVILVHIANPAKESEIPFAFQPTTIISKYEAKLTGKLLNTDYLIIKQSKQSTSTHALVQVNAIAIKENCTVLVIGFHGHKLNKQKSDLSKGINYIIKNIKIPVIIVKENSTRKSRDSGEFTWMASIEQANSRSFKAFQFALNYINLEKDRVVGAHIKFYNDSLANEVKEIFEKTCQDTKVANYSFEIVDKDKNLDIGVELSNMVNYNDKENVDFFVLGHNPTKYQYDNNECCSSPLTTIIKSAKSNILFYS